MTHSKITDLIHSRLGFLAKDKKANAEKLRVKILIELLKSFEELSCDYIIEALDYVGVAPTILHSPYCNGYAVTSDVNGPISDEPIDGTFTVTVKEDQWHETINEALFYYLESIQP